MELFRRPFTIRVPDVAEDVLPDEDPPAHVCRLAAAKAKTAARVLDEGLVIGADTVVVLEGKIIGKPAGGGEARELLTRLSGRTHEVYTGVAVADAATEEVRTVVVCSRVTMKPIAAGEIACYVAGGEPLDKAGAYAAQGEGRRFIERVEGSFSNVVGLPMPELHRLLTEFGLEVVRPDCS